MSHSLWRASRLAIGTAAVLGAVSVALPAAAEFKSITPTLSSRTITLNGHQLTVDQLVQIARGGAKVQIAPEAKQRAADAFGLMIQAQAENIAVYRWNRGAGAQREVVNLRGDPESQTYKDEMERRHGPNSGGGGGGIGGLGPDVEDEDALRAMLAVNANIVTYEAASPGMVQGFVDLLNNGVYPVISARGNRGESDFITASATMQGKGFAYYKGVRMPASEALQKAGLKPVRLDGNDEAMNTTSTLTAGRSALLVHDARQLLEWADLTYAMVLNGMNSSVTPMSMPVQTIRPFPWVNYMSARVMDMIKGGYLFDNDPARIIQDPESMRATPWRQGGAWEAWANLRNNTLIQMNSSDHNPTARPDVSPTDSWELSTPQFQKYYVKGGKYSNGKSGFIFSNSNWDPYPLVNSVEALGPALIQLGVIMAQTVNRFSDPFFTVVRAQEVLNPGGGGGGGEGFGQFNGGGGGSMAWLWQEMQAAAQPIAPEGLWSGSGVGDISAVPLMKLDRANTVIAVMREMMAEELLTAAYWMDVRKMQNGARGFGKAPEAALAAFRKVVPLRRDPKAPAQAQSTTQIATAFLKNTPASTFYPSNTIAMPGGNDGNIPMAKPTKVSSK